MNSAPEEHCISQEHAQTLHTASTGIVFFPALLLMMLSEHKVTLDPGVAPPGSKGEDGSWKIMAGFATPPTQRMFSRIPPGILHHRAGNTHPESKKQWGISARINETSSLAVSIP